MKTVRVEWGLGGDSRTFTLEDGTAVVFSSYPDSRNCDRDMVRHMCQSFHWSPSHRDTGRMILPNYPYSGGGEWNYSIQVTDEQERLLRLSLHPERAVLDGTHPVDNPGIWLITPHWETDEEWLARWPAETRALLRPGEKVCSTVQDDELTWIWYE